MVDVVPSIKWKLNHDYSIFRINLIIDTEIRDALFAQ
jgi:hypothetical protein